MNNPNFSHESPYKVLAEFYKTKHSLSKLFTTHPMREALTEQLTAQKKILNTKSQQEYAALTKIIKENGFVCSAKEHIFPECAFSSFKYKFKIISDNVRPIDSGNYELLHVEDNEQHPEIIALDLHTLDLFYWGFEKSLITDINLYNYDKVSQMYSGVIDEEVWLYHKLHYDISTGYSVLVLEYAPDFKGDVDYLVHKCIVKDDGFYCNEKRICKTPDGDRFVVLPDNSTR